MHRRYRRGSLLAGVAMMGAECLITRQMDSVTYGYIPKRETEIISDQSSAFVEAVLTKSVTLTPTLVVHRMMHDHQRNASVKYECISWMETEIRQNLQHVKFT